MTELTETLAQVQADLAALQQPGATRQTARPFVEDFYKLYTLIRETEGGPIPAPVQAFLQESSKGIRPALLLADRYVSGRIDTLLGATWEIDEWIGLCEARSAREALRELYGPYIDLEDTMPDDPETDEAIRDRARGEAFQELGKTPVTFPASHWWWALSEI